jgi:hypothetical protein
MSAVTVVSIFELNLMKSLIARCWSLKPEERPSFSEILMEFEVNLFEVVPRSSPEKIFEYARSVLDWEGVNSRRALMPEPVDSDASVIQSDHK